MAKGAAKAKAANRRRREAQAVLDDLRAKLAAEEALLAEVATEAHQVEQARQELIAEGAARDRDTTAELSALREQREELEQALRTAQGHYDSIQTAWDKVTKRVTDQFGGGNQGLEGLMRIIGGGGYLADTPAAHLGTGAVVRLQKVRGERTDLPANLYEDKERSIAETVRGMVRDRLFAPAEAAGVDMSAFDRKTATSEQAAAFDQVEAHAKQLLEQKPSARNADALHSWHPLPLLSSTIGTTSGLTEDLGTIDSLETPEHAEHFTEEWPAATAALTATHRSRLATTNVDQLTDQWAPRLTADETLNRILGKHHSPLHTGPLHPRPGRAASLRHLYAKSSLGMWSRAEEHNDPSTSLWGLTSVALTCATAFWMPAGQTHAFADSDPLSDEDRADLLLPFPQLFMAFAEPLELGPTVAPNPEQHRTLTALDSLAHTLRTSKHEPVFRDLLYTDEAVTYMGTLSVTDVLDIRGGRVEGVLLMGDSMGRLEDTFAWCISIPSGASGTLGRHVIPASLARTQHRALIENLVAVASWADWHEPDDATSLPPGLSQRELNDLTGTAAFKRDADRSGAGGVRVLNVKTSIKTADPAEPTGRHVTPHVRRGHWRRQRYGTGRQQVRRIRIAPLVVNAHRGLGGHRVYVIPRTAR